jgi:hypothetical protein
MPRSFPITAAQHSLDMEARRIHFNDVRMKQLATYVRKKKQTVRINLIG